MNTLSTKAEAIIRWGQASPSEFMQGCGPNIPTETFIDNPYKLDVGPNFKVTCDALEFGVQAAGARISEMKKQATSLYQPITSAISKVEQTKLKLMDAIRVVKGQATLAEAAQEKAKTSIENSELLKEKEKRQRLAVKRSTARNAMRYLALYQDHQTFSSRADVIETMKRKAEVSCEIFHARKRRKVMASELSYGEAMKISNPYVREEILGYVQLNPQEQQSLSAARLDQIRRQKEKNNQADKSQSLWTSIGPRPCKALYLTYFVNDPTKTLLVNLEGVQVGARDEIPHGRNVVILEDQRALPPDALGVLQKELALLEKTEM